MLDLIIKDEGGNNLVEIQRILTSYISDEIEYTSEN